jgi:hypothetical protein
MNTFTKTSLLALCAITADASLSSSLRGYVSDATKTVKGLEQKLGDVKQQFAYDKENDFFKQMNPTVDPKCLKPQSMIPEVCEAPWVFCIDAVCDDTPTIVDGVAVSKCKCWEQKSSYSFIPASKNQGAACVMGYEGGSEMCDDMKSGKELISTYWLKPEDGQLVPNNSSYLPESSRAVCPSGTKFAYCWGAKCNKVENEKTGEEEVICDCPIMTGSGDITIEAASCTKDGSPCSGIHNSNPPGLTSGTNDKAIYNYKNGDSCDAAGTFTR